jgi:hypothetical protein
VKQFEVEILPIWASLRTMKIKVLSVDERKKSERISFEFIDQQNSWGLCYPSLRFLQDNQSFSVKPGDDLIVGDFIPDFITGRVTPVIFPEFIQKL